VPSVGLAVRRLGAVGGGHGFRYVSPHTVALNCEKCCFCCLSLLAIGALFATLLEGDGCPCRFLGQRGLGGEL